MRDNIEIVSDIIDVAYKGHKSDDNTMKICANKYHYLEEELNSNMRRYFFNGMITSLLIILALMGLFNVW